MPINLTCPQCGQRMTMNFTTISVSCPHCGYQRDSGLDERETEMHAKGPRQEVGITNESKIDPRAVSLFETGQDYLYQGDKQKALHSFQEAVDLQDDFLDAHLWIAKTSDDQAVKRDHLNSILAYDSGNAEAVRMLMVLDGKLTPEDAARTYGNNDLPTQRADGAIGVDTVTLRCPKCKGDLTVDEENGLVKCRFCGYVGAKPTQSAVGSAPLVSALLERRAKAVKWVIGEHLLQCPECGATRTIPGNQLSSRCPFCGSNHVIQQDALKSFDQPDGLIPFAVTREQAGAHIKEHLRTFGERMKGWFDDRKVASATLNGYYLPIWLFDATVEISRTMIANNPSSDNFNRPKIEDAYQRTTINDAMYDIQILATNSPYPVLLHQLGDYRFDAIVPYEPELLAKYSAQLYTTDVDEAALDAHSIVSDTMRAKHNQRAPRDYTVNVFCTIQQMSFRLVLVPVWIGQLTEEDKDHRIALVHGQTGNIVLGQTEKYREAR